jgi:surface protein
MERMFFGATTFNQPIGNWDVSSVTNMNSMFEQASAFNQPIEDWDVSSVRFMEQMFEDAGSFNQPVQNWDVSSVMYMDAMFEEASSFDQPIDAWDVSSVLGMDAMFYNASSFNQNLCGWNDQVDTAKVGSTRMFMLSGCDDTSDPTTSSSWCQSCGGDSSGQAGMSSTVYSSYTSAILVVAASGFLVMTY